MAKKPVRNAAYYEDRLKREYPTIYADLKAGKYRTVTDAAIAAGLRNRRTRLHELKNAWSKASHVEQREFLSWLRSSRALMLSIAAASPPLAPIAVNRCLVPLAVARIDEIISKRHLTLGQVMVEMGFSPLNASLGMALARGTRLQPSVIAALEKWLAANATV
ncbi:hypothetical protein [Ochrobactrum sp. A-1]|uniref:hypothetical protein n=1 Tax=Ochrobactrum sp. A-1 TaxID=2920940 RepID=UPI001F0AF8F2|nr:hypothetical protein [Ochrobactrum sp. A-1]